MSSTSDSPMPAVDELGYAAALAELESIVSGMEQGQVDVDQLTSKIKRATELVGYCRDRLTTVQAQVEDMTLEASDRDDAQ